MYKINTENNFKNSSFYDFMRHDFAEETESYDEQK
jgi:hypothetical protein